MIICFNNDDPKIVDAAYLQAVQKRYDKNTFGIAYCYVPDHNDDVKQLTRRT